MKCDLCDQENYDKCDQCEMSLCKAHLASVPGHSCNSGGAQQRGYHPFNEALPSTAVTAGQQLTLEGVADDEHQDDGTSLQVGI